MEGEAGMGDGIGSCLEEFSNAGFRVCFLILAYFIVLHLCGIGKFMP